MICGSESWYMSEFFNWQKVVHVCPHYSKLQCEFLSIQTLSLHTYMVVSAILGELHSRDEALMSFLEKL